AIPRCAHAGCSSPPGPPPGAPSRLPRSSAAAIQSAGRPGEGSVPAHKCPRAGGEDGIADRGGSKPRRFSESGPSRWLGAPAGPYVPVCPVWPACPVAAGGTLPGASREDSLATFLFLSLQTPIVLTSTP